MGPKLIFAKFVIVFCLLLLPTGQALSQAKKQTIAKSSSKIQSIRSHSNSSDARFVVELTNFNNYNIFTLNNPYRLVVDIENTTNSIKHTGIENALIDKFRYATTNDRFRIVLEVKKPFTIHKYGTLKGLLSDKNSRIYIDIRVTSKFKPVQFKSTTDGESYVSKETQQVPKAKAKVLQKNTTTQSKSQKNSKIIIVLDPGHGGKDPGAVGKYNNKSVYEKDYALKFSKTLAEQINKLSNYKAILTRNDDSFIPLRDRFAIAEKSSADLFLSIHADSLADRSVNGVSIYSLSEDATDKEAKELANQNNRSDILNDYSLDNYSKNISSILINLAQESNNRKSWLLANSLIKTIKTKYKTITKPIRKADFAVLKSPNIPSLLFEIGFLSNSSDLKRLQTNSYYTNLAKIVTAGIKKYFESN